MKLVQLLIFASVLVSCNQWGQQEANRLNKELATIPILSMQFDSLMQIVRQLPDENRLSVLLPITEREEINVNGIAKQETLLFEALSLALEKDRKEIILRLITFYVTADGVATFPSAVEKGLIWCENLKNKYSLSSKEEQKVKALKVSLFMNKGQLAESLPISYELLSEHRAIGDHARVVDDLLTVSTHYSAMGDHKQSLAFCEEAYLLATDKGLVELQKKCALILATSLSDAGLYKKAIACSMQNGLAADSLLTPSVYFFLSHCYLKLDKQDTARLYLEQSMKFTSNESGRMQAYARIAETYITENREDSATVFLDKALAAFQERISLSKLPLNKTKQYLPDYFMPLYVDYALLLQRNGKSERALQALRQIEPLLEWKTGYSFALELQITALKQLATFYRNAGEDKKALDLLMRRDSLQEVCAKVKVEDRQKLFERF